jgi:hypothetical protein
LSCDPSSSTPTTTLQKSDVSSERFMTVAEEPAARRCVASRYLHTNNGHMDMDMGHGHGMGMGMGMGMDMACACA